MEVNKTDYKVMFPEVMRLSDRDINTIKTVLMQASKRSNYDMCHRVALKVKEVLKITHQVRTTRGMSYDIKFQTDRLTLCVTPRENGAPYTTCRRQARGCLLMTAFKRSRSTCV